MRVQSVRADVLSELLDDARDDAWFFDTELLVVAQRRGMRIHEVAVDWVEDPDSRVDIFSTAVSDLRGVARLAIAEPIARFLAIGIVGLSRADRAAAAAGPAIGAKRGTLR